MAMDVTFRWATEKDAGAILGLVRELAEFEKELDKVKTTEADFARDLSLGHFVCVLAVVNEREAVGMALMHNRYSTWDGRCVHLEDLYVKPEHRSAGVGKRLIECCVKHARETGSRRLCWEVLDWNTKAISFYDRLGAQIKTSWRCVRLEGDALRDFEVSEEVQALGLPPHQ